MGKTLVGLLLFFQVPPPPAKSIFLRIEERPVTFGTLKEPGCLRLNNSAAFRLPPLWSSFSVYRNGQRETAELDYSVSGDQFTFFLALPNELVVCDISY